MRTPGEILARILVRLAALGLDAEEGRLFRKEWHGELWRARREHIGGMGMVRLAGGSWADMWTRRSLGTRTRMKGDGTMRGWVEDARIAVRTLRRTPGFTLVALVTLGLGLGGATTVLSVLDSVVLSPLPYPESDRLVKVENEVPGVGEGTVWQMSTAQYVYIQERLPAFDGVGLYRAFGNNLETPSGPVRVSGWTVTPDLLPLLGGQPRVGRLFTAEEGTRNEPVRLLLSEEFWESQFGADPEVVGRTVSLGGEAVEIVGVVARGFRVPGATTEGSQVYTPIRIDRSARFYSSHIYPGVARLAPGTSPEGAEAALVSMLPVLPERFPQAYGSSFLRTAGFKPRLMPLKTAVVGDVAGQLWVVMGGVALVLLIAIANVANLFVVRVEERRPELAIRSALGASITRIGRLLTAEAIALSAAGGAIAVLIGFWGVPLLRSIAPQNLPRLEEIGPNWTALLSTLVLAGVCAAVLVAYPLLTHTRSSRRTGGDPSRSATAGREKQRARDALVVLQVALALTLASGAGLLIQSIAELRALDPGFATEGTLTLDVYLDPTAHVEDARTWQTWRRIVEGVESIPGVLSAGVGSDLPLSGGFGCTVQGFEDTELVYGRLEAADLTTCAGQTFVGPGYFESLGVPVIAGRTFVGLDNDAPETAAVVVSEAFAKRFWGDVDPIGRGVAPSGRTEGPFYRVVGVVGDIPRETLEGERANAVYYPLVMDPNTPGNWGRWASPNMSLVVRTALAEPLSITESIRRVVAQADPRAPLGAPTATVSRVERSMAHVAFVTLLLEIAAGIALILSAVGLYGVISYMVGRQTRAIGLRLALGAEPRSIQLRVITGSVGLAAVGLVLGLAMVIGSGRVLQGLLYGVTAADPRVLGVTVLLLAATATLASWIPARRASRIDPLEALRTE